MKQAVSLMTYRGWICGDGTPGCLELIVSLPESSVFSFDFEETNVLACECRQGERKNDVNNEQGVLKIGGSSGHSARTAMSLPHGLQPFQGLVVFNA